MNLSEAYTLARSLMNQHGLQSWGFEFDKSVSRFGACHYRKKKITLSRRIVLDNPENEVILTLLHEVAHALSYLRHGRKGCGHGTLWKQVCVEIGAKPERCYDSSKVNNTTIPKFVLRHKETREIYAKYHRRPKWANRVHEVWAKNDKSLIGKLELASGMSLALMEKPKSAVREFTFD